MIQEALDLTRRSKDRIREAQCLIVRGLLEDSTRRQRTWGRAETILRECGAGLDLQGLLLLRLDQGLAGGRAIQILKELLARAAGPDGDVVLCTLEPERTASVLSRALSLGIETRRITDLLCELGDRAVPYLAEQAEGADETTRATMVEALTRIGGPIAIGALQKIARRGAGRPSTSRAAEEVARAPIKPLRIEALGKFEVRLGDTPIPADRWNSRRALRLFQFLLLARFRWVPKEQVMEGLWPDADPERATTSLWQSVYQLRRTLEPGLTELRNSRYVRFQNESYRIEPGEGFIYDVLEFELKLRSGERLLGEGKPSAGRRDLRRAVEIYRGDFLAESPYVDFAADEREAQKDRLTRCLHLLVESLVQSRRWTEVIPLCRRGLDADPYHEGFHSRLIEANLALGNRLESLDGYQRYEDLLSRDLGLLPSPRMREIADRIAASGRRRSDTRRPSSVRPSPSTP